MLKFLKSKVVAAGAGVSGLLLATSSHAQTTPADFSTLTSSIDFSTVSTAVMAVGAVMIGVYVTIKGAKIVLAMVRGA